MGPAGVWSWERQERKAIGPGRQSNGGRGRASMREIEMASTKASEGQKGVALKMTKKDSYNCGRQNCG